MDENDILQKASKLIKKDEDIDISAQSNREKTIASKVIKEHNNGNSTRHASQRCVPRRVIFLGLITMDEGKNLESSVNINYIFNKWNLMFRKNGIIFFRTLMVKA